MELTLICIALIVLIFLLIKQKEEISKLRKGLAETFERLIHMQTLLEDIRKESPTLPAESEREEKTDTSFAETKIPVYEEIQEQEEPYLEEEHTQTVLPPPLPVESVAVQESTDNVEHEIIQAQGEPAEKLSWFERFKRNNPISKNLSEKTSSTRSVSLFWCWVSISSSNMLSIKIGSTNLPV